MKSRLYLVLFLSLLTVSYVLSKDEKNNLDSHEDDNDPAIVENAMSEDEEEPVSEDDDDDDGVNVEVESDLLESYNYESPTADSESFYFAEHFDNKEDFEKKWIKSMAKKDDIPDEIAKYDGKWELEEPKKQIWKNDLGLVLKSKAKHAAISSKLSKVFKFDTKPLIVQYEVTMQDGQNCGGSYLKLLSASKETENLTMFNDKTPYTIMFGPDKCGNDVKLHFIFRHVNPKNKTITEKHCRKPRERLEEPFKDKLPHLYQLLLNPDNTFQIHVDHKKVIEGSLLNDFEPPVNPPMEIDDPNDKKPEDWDEREKIPDPTAKKPDDWDEDAPPQIPDPNAVKPSDWLDDEEEMIPDPNAKKPDDWDTEIDGEWEPPLIENPVCENAVGCGKWKAPLIPNPDYKGKWRAPLIDNPNYQGKWLPKKIENPDYFKDDTPFKMTPISAVGIEIWSMSSDILFDNILITDDIDLADDWASKTFDLKRKQIDKESDTFFGKLVAYISEIPYIIGISAVFIGLIVIFIIYSLFNSKKNEKKPKINAAKSKKTDEFSPDDLIENKDGENDKTTLQERNAEEEGKEIESENCAEEPNQNTSPKSRKSDLEVDNSTDNTFKLTKSNSDDNNEINQENNLEEIGEDIEEQNKNVEGARKRKPRKE